jgi:hypothetical protein
MAFTSAGAFSRKYAIKDLRSFLTILMLALRRRREWVSKRKHHGVVFSRRDTPQSKERGKPRLLRRRRATMFSEGQ